MRRPLLELTNTDLREQGTETASTTSPPNNQKEVVAAKKTKTSVGVSETTNRSALTEVSASATKKTR